MTTLAKFLDGRPCPQGHYCPACSLEAATTFSMSPEQLARHNRNEICAVPSVAGNPLCNARGAAMSTGPHDAGLDGTIPPAPDLTQKIRELRAADRRAETETDAERIERVGAGMRASVSAPREDGHQRSSTSPAMPPDWCGVPAGDLDAKIRELRRTR